LATSTFTTASVSRVTPKRILCPLDLTENSGDALVYAFKLAAAYGASLIAYHCAKDDSARKSRARPELAELKRQLKTAVSSRLSSEGGADLNWETLVTDGDPVEMIAWEAALRRIDLIVMCSRRRPMRAALLGSTAGALCRIAPCPVLVTHPDVREAGQPRFERILVAYDFSGDSELALANGFSLATEFNAELHLLHVMSTQNGSAMLESDSLQSPAVFAEIGLRLRRAIPREADPKRGLNLALREGAVYREVLSYAEDRNVDLICMGASGSGYGMHALFGSNSDRVIRQARCPVLIARPLKPAQGGYS
jgi:nucleotide-binding universal stress UspA family protein